MAKQHIVALLYDFDKTLCTRDMQEYTFIPSLGMKAEDFWAEAERVAAKEQMDSIIAHLLFLCFIVFVDWIISKNHQQFSKFKPSANYFRWGLGIKRVNFNVLKRQTKKPNKNCLAFGRSEVT